MKKKALLLVLILLCVLALPACGNTENKTSSNTSTETEQTINTSVANGYNKRTNYIFGDKEYGFDGDSKDPDYVREHFYNIGYGSIVFMNSKIVEEKENDKYKYAVHENGFAELKGIKNPADTIEAPSNIDGYPVAYIGKEAFVNTNVKNVIIPDGILAIGEYAFSQMRSLRKVTLPNTLLAICADAFEGCANLCEINFPDSLQAIGEYAFSECKKLKGFTPPRDLRYIGSDAFCHCAGVSGNLIFNDNIKSISGGSFVGTSIQSLVLPDGLNSVAACAFSSCEKLKTVKFPATVGDCDNGLGWGCFGGCISLEEINIPENLTGISSSVFQDCRSLKSIKIPASVTSVMDDAFDRCYALRDIYFESKDCGIYYNSFLFTPGLTVHAPKGGSVEEFFMLRPLVKFEAVG